MPETPVERVPDPMVMSNEEVWKRKAMQHLKYIERLEKALSLISSGRFCKDGACLTAPHAPSAEAMAACAKEALETK